MYVTSIASNALRRLADIALVHSQRTVNQVLYCFIKIVDAMTCLLIANLNTVAKPAFQHLEAFGLGWELCIGNAEGKGK
jgi:hypothetical protein